MKIKKLPQNLKINNKIIKIYYNFKTKKDKIKYNY